MKQMLAMAHEEKVSRQAAHGRELASREDATRDALRAGQLRRVVRMTWRSSLQAAWRMWEAAVVTVRSAAALRVKEQAHAQLVQELRRTHEVAVRGHVERSEAELGALKARLTAELTELR